jgi:predicted deacetylase
MKAATAGRPREQSLVVSLHDVSPRTQAVFTAMLAELAALGVSRCSLLVIPDHHGEGHMLNDAGFCRWLEVLAARGHELVIHGYYHRRRARGGETWRDRWITRVYTKGEGEFYDLPKADAAALLARAQADFRQLDAPAPTGFIAPAWLLGTAAAEAVREAGLRYTTYLRGVEDFASGEFISAQSLVYSCRNAWRRVCSLAWNAALAQRLRAAPLLRLSLHPPDYQHACIWRQVRGAVQRFAAERTVSTYDAFVLGRKVQV